MSFPAVFHFSDLDGGNGFRLNGIDRNDSSGTSVAGAGDVNGDGIDDLIIGAPRTGSGGGPRNYAGESYVVFGRSDGFDPALELSDLDGTSGFRLDGIDRDDNSGSSVAGAGDVNGDGFNDLIIGAFGADPGGRNRAGESYVVFGREGGFGSALALSALDGTNGFRLDGVDEEDISGYSVAGAGDVNDDGLDDLIIGAYWAAPGGRPGAGETYVVYGREGGFGSALELSALDGTNGFSINGIDSGDYSGTSVAGAGDVNGDGIDDLIIGAVGADPGGRRFAGESYVVFGRSVGLGSALQLSALNGTNGFRLDGINSYDWSGFSVAGAGDVNGDGLADLIVGAWDGDPGGKVGAGESYVVFGRSGGFGSALRLSSLDGTTGFRIDGDRERGGSGWSVAGAGDVNGDELADLIVGDRSAKAAVVFGRTGGFGSALDISALDGSNGFKVATFGGGTASVASAGDVNRDGIDDVIIGANLTDPGRGFGTGVTYVVFGRAPDPGENLRPVVEPLVVATNEDAPAPVTVNLLRGASDPDFDPLAVTGFTQTGGPAAPSLTVTGTTLSFDPDDFDALNAGQQATLTFGYGVSDGSLTTPQTLTITIDGRDEGPNQITGTAGNDSLTGTAAADSIAGRGGKDTLSGLAGDDTIEGDQGGDRLFGGDGDDSLAGGRGDDRLWGDAGNDTLNGDGGEDQLFGGDGNDRLIGRHSHDTLTGGAGADAFYFHPDPTLSGTGDAAEVIVDFSVADGDVINLVKLDISDYATLQGLFTETADGTVIDLSPYGGRDIFVAGVTVAILDQQGNFVL